MSDAQVLGVGTIIFLVTVWAVLVAGYYRFGRWYDQDTADEIERRIDVNAAAAAQGRPSDERDPLDVSHDHPETLAASRAASRSDGSA